MKVIPYASAIGSIKYGMLCTKPVVYLAMILARGYDSDPGLDHWTAVKVILSYLRGLRKYFSVMEVIKSYVDASFYTDPDDSESQSRYILKVGAISYNSSMESIVDIEICKIHTDLNVADPLTKLLSRAKHDQHQDSMGVRIITVKSRLLTLVQVGD